MPGDDLTQPSVLKFLRELQDYGMSMWEFIGLLNEYDFVLLPGKASDWMRVTEI